MCGETSAVMPGALGGLHDDRPGALPREPAAPGVEEHRAPRPAAPPSGREQLRAAADQVGLHRLAGEAADRHDPLLGALAAQQHGAAGRVRRARGRRRPARRPRRCAHRCRRAPPAAPGRAAPARSRPRRPPRAAVSTSPSGIALGSRLAGRRRPHPGRRVGGGQPVLERELVEPADRHHRAAGRGRAQRRVLAVPLAQRHQEPAHVCSVTSSRSVTPTRVEVGEVAAQVAAVGLHRVLGQPALDDEVVEVGPDGAHERAGTRRALAHRLSVEQLGVERHRLHAVRLGDRARW